LQIWVSTRKLSLRAELVVASLIAKLNRRTKLVVFSEMVSHLRQIQHDRIFSVRQAVKRATTLATDCLMLWKCISKIGRSQFKNITRFAFKLSQLIVSHALTFCLGLFALRSIGLTVSIDV
jgi:hypothetical protein